MKRINLLATGLLFVAVFAISGFAQGGAQAATKIGWINTSMFADDSGGGVTKYLNAIKALETEGKPRVTELDNMRTKLQTISDDIKKMTGNPAVPVNQAAVQGKQEEGQRVQREFDFKKKEYEAWLESRSGQVLGPVSADISKAIQEYAKQKGFSVILDIDKLGQAGIILALDGTSDVTKDFITFYNARPASTATTTAPR